MAETIFNDPEKLKRTRENLAKHFGGGEDKGPTLSDKVRGLLGVDNPVREAMKRRQEQIQARGYGK